MRSIFFTLAALAVSTLAEVAFDDGGVADLTTSSFDEFAESNDSVLVAFHAPWCGHCKAFMPKYADAVEAFKGTGVGVAKVDGDAQGELMSKHGIESFPTIALFKKKGAIKYVFEGERDVAAIQEWVNEMSQDPVAAVEASEVPSHVSDHARVFVFRGAAEGKLHKEFQEAADALRTHATFLRVAGEGEAALEAHFGFGEQLTFSEAEHTTVDDFVMSHTVPSFGKVDENTFELYLERASDSLVWACFDPENVDEQAKAVSQHFIELSQRYKKSEAEDKLSPVMVYLDTNEYAEHARVELGCREMDADTIAVALNIGDLQSEEISEVKKYVRVFKTVDLNADVLDKYIKDAQAGDAEVVTEPEEDLDELDADDIGMDDELLDDDLLDEDEDADLDEEEL